jgi:hypothetical protein
VPLLLLLALSWGRQQLQGLGQGSTGAWGADWGVEYVQQALLSIRGQLMQQQVLLLLPAAVLLALVAVRVLLLLCDSQLMQALVQQHADHVVCKGTTRTGRG